MRRGIVPDHLHDAIANGGGRREIEDHAAVVLEAKGAGGERQRVRGDDRHDGAELGVGTLEKLAARGDVLKQLADGDGGAAVACGRAGSACAGERIAGGRSFQAGPSVGQDEILRGGWQPPRGPIGNRPAA